MNQTVAYLSGTVEEGLVFDAGQDVVLPIDPTRRLKDYVVQDPKGKAAESLSPPAGSDSLVDLGPAAARQLVGEGVGDRGGGEVIGFSVNPPVSETQFVPLETADLNRLFPGKDRYALADDPKSLEKAIIARPGRPRTVPLDHAR